MRSLLRWSSLVASAVVLGALGASRVHHTSFPLFLAVLLALSLGTVVVFLATRGDDGHADGHREPHNRRSPPR